MSANAEFVLLASNAVHGKRSVSNAIERWNDALTRILSSSTRLHKLFDSINLTQSSNGYINVGETTGFRFALTLRQGNAAQAIEYAIGTRLSDEYRSLLQLVDRDTKTYFSDYVVTHRNNFVKQARSQTGIPSGRVVDTANELNIYVLSSRVLRRNVDKTLERIRVTKRLEYLGGIVHVDSATLGSLYDNAVALSKVHIGCFMYRKNISNDDITRCQIAGCSCPITNFELWCNNVEFLCPDFTIEGSRCDEAKHHCARCYWYEEDADDIQYVNRDCLPDYTFAQCEKYDAMDALWELRGYWSEIRSQR